MIQATQGHSRELGVSEDALPVDEEVLYVAHETSMEASGDIVVNGLSRCGRLRVHFRARDSSGELRETSQMRLGTQVSIAVSAAHAREEGLVCYRSSNNVILSAGQQGVIHPRFIRRD